MCDGRAAAWAWRRMATYRLATQVIGRAKGQSAVAAAAYRSGDRLRDDLTGIVHDYRARHGVVYAEIVAPPSAPAWATERETLWNVVQRGESHPRAQYAREILVSLPHELSDGGRRELLRAFATEQLTSAGMVGPILPIIAYDSLGKRSRESMRANVHWVSTFSATIPRRPTAFSRRRRRVARASTCAPCKARSRRSVLAAAEPVAWAGITVSRGFASSPIRAASSCAARPAISSRRSRRPTQPPRRSRTPHSTRRPPREVTSCGESQGGGFPR